MSEDYYIFCPITQFQMIRPDMALEPNPLLNDGFSFISMSPQIRRKIANLVKEKNCSNNILKVLMEAETIFTSKVPFLAQEKFSVLDACKYSFIADVILNKLFDCMLLFGYVPKPFKTFIWFLSKGIPSEENTNNFQLIRYDFFEDIPIQPVIGDLLVLWLHSHWDKLKPILLLDKIISLCKDEKKQQFYLEAGNKQIKQRAEKFIKDYFDEHPDSPHIKPDFKAFTAPWFFEGYVNAFMGEIDKFQHKKYKQPSGNRFIRAYQAFTQASRLENPHKFVSIMTSLETLFCADEKEITFQLALGMAWLLNPDNCEEREQSFKKAKNLYNIRSKIVHGSQYDIDEVDKETENLEKLARKVFNKLLSDDSIYKILFDKNSSLWVKYIKGLVLGRTA